VALPWPKSLQYSLSASQFKYRNPIQQPGRVAVSCRAARGHFIPPSRFNGRAVWYIVFALWAQSKATMTTFDKDLDVRGLNCPLPILRAKKALADLKSGQVLRVLATDPGSVKDFQAFAKQTANQLLSHAEEDRVFTFFMKKK